MTPQPLLRLDGVTRRYRVGDHEISALGGVDLTVERGEFVAVMGSSGSGKSTLMSILGCLDRPTSGHYALDGIDVGQLDEDALAGLRSERLGFVFQSFNLLPRTAAVENVALPLFYAASGRRDGRMAQAREALAFVGLRGRERNTPGQLSGGEQQRVAIARALINRPSLLLADEPTGNLDTRTSHEIMEMLVALNREQGVTVILVTHEADIAAYADRILTMRDGLVISDEHVAAPVARGRTHPAPAPAEQRPANGAVASLQGFAAMIVATAAQAIWRNKMRSALTMLGVFIGVAALIAMVSVGQGANEAVRKQIEGLGTNVVVVVPGATTTGGVRAGFGSASSLTIEDARALARDAPAIARVGYLIRQQGQTQYANQNWTTTIQGVSASYPSITNWRLAAGRGITVDDDAKADLVVAIGQTVYRQLFKPYEDPVGAIIQVRSVPMRIVGVLAAKGQSPFGQDQDDLVMIPFRTAERKVLGVAVPSQQPTPLNWPYPAPPNPYNLRPQMTGFVNAILVQAVAPDQVQTAIRQLTQVMLTRHRIRAGQVKDFDVRNLSQYVETAESSSRIMSILLAAVASISLLVGGIGIMNILLVSVTERTREIGLRMAIGARRVQVLLQFLAEAVFLSVTGGLMGIVMGVAFSWVISHGFGWPAPFSPAAVVGGFLFAAAVGVFFGYYPARKAARLDPIEALRYE